MRTILIAVSLTLALAVPARAAAPVTDADGAALLGRLIARVAASYDSTHGGFTHDGAPNAAAVDLAWRLAKDGQPEWGARARCTVDATWALYDSVGGGLVESRRGHGEMDKRTDSNARRLENRIDAWLVEHAEADRRATLALLDFFERVIEDGRGGFVAGQVGDRALPPAANGLAAHAYLRWGAATGETRWRDFALKSLDRVWEQEWTPELGLVRRDNFGTVTSVPRLDDQCEFGRAALLAAHVAGRESDLAHARALGDLLLQRYEDVKQGGMRAQAVPGKDGGIKKAPRESGGNARAALFLAELASVSGEAKYREAARRVVGAFAHDLEKGGAEDAEWALALRALARAELPDRPEWQNAPPPSPRVLPPIPLHPKRSGTHRG